MTEASDNHSLTTYVNNSSGQSVSWKAISYPSNGATISNPAAAIDNNGNFILTYALSDPSRNTDLLEYAVFKKTGVNNYSAPKGVLTIATVSHPSSFGESDVLIGPNFSVDVSFVQSNLTKNGSMWNFTDQLIDAHFINEDATNYNWRPIKASTQNHITDVMLVVPPSAKHNLDVSWDYSYNTNSGGAYVISNVYP